MSVIKTNGVLFMGEKHDGILLSQFDGAVGKSVNSSKNDENKILFDAEYFVASFSLLAI